MRHRSPKKAINQYNTEGEEMFMVKREICSGKIQNKFSLVTFNMIKLFHFVKRHLLE